MYNETRKRYNLVTFSQNNSMPVIKHYSATIMRVLLLQHVGCDTLDRGLSRKRRWSGNKNLTSGQDVVMP